MRNFFGYEFYKPGVDHEENFENFVTTRSAGHDPIYRLKFKQYKARTPFLCHEKFGCECGIRHAYNPANSVTSIIFDLCEIARNANLKLAGLEYTLFRADREDAARNADTAPSHNV